MSNEETKEIDYNKDLYVLCKPGVNTYGKFFRHSTQRSSCPMTHDEAIRWHQDAVKRGRIKYELYKLTLIEDEGTI